MELSGASCPAQAANFQELDKLKLEIAAADTVEEAREIALPPAEDAIDALNKAKLLMPSSDELIAAENRLSEARARILAATSQKQVADELSGVMLAGLDDNAAKVGIGKTECHYTNGEVVAIVIGLILGIIPGLILLVLLC